MILTSSRALSTKCWRKTFNLYHRDLDGPRNFNLTDGSAVHAAIAHGLATRDWNQALEIANAEFDKEVALADIPPEQRYIADDHWDCVVEIVRKYEEQYVAEGYDVIQPECSFSVELPNTHHNDITLHWFDRHVNKYRWGMPTPDAILAHAVGLAHGADDPSCLCWQPHRVMGKTDALVKWNGPFWLLEHKTTAASTEQWWDTWELDLQPTLYLYGIWKTTGILPNGVLVNKLFKPSEKQVSAWNAKRKDPATYKSAKDYITYERRAFLRTVEDLERIEDVITDLCDEWEERILKGRFNPVLSRGVCIDYNRKCDFWTACSSHEEAGSFNGCVPREHRYDDEAYEALVQLVGGAR